MAPSSSLAASPWQPDPSIIRQTIEKRPGFNFEESKVPPFSLPLLIDRSSDQQAWRSRRETLLKLFEDRMFGRSPAGAESMNFNLLARDETALEGNATLHRTEIALKQDDREFRFECTVFLPNKSKGPHPVFLLLNNRRRPHSESTGAASDFWPVENIIARGYGAAEITVRTLAGDSPEGFRDGVISLFEGDSEEERPGNAWATLAAWAWGARRAMDYFETLPEIDSSRVAVVGHSRGGKAALWVGACDERFAMVVSNSSGCGGAALSRRRFGETIARINSRFPHWFCTNFRDYNDREADLPFEQHMLLALIAPRAIYVSSADEDLWADPKGEFLSLAYASPTFELFGHRGLLPDVMPGLDTPLWGDRQAYHIRPGQHDLTRKDWNYFMDFSDHLWPRAKN